MEIEDYSNFAELYFNDIDNPISVPLSDLKLSKQLVKSLHKVVIITPKNKKNSIVLYSHISPINNAKEFIIIIFGETYGRFYFTKNEEGVYLDKLINKAMTEFANKTLEYRDLIINEMK